jgi:2-polyprenyl-3-methyl-5-hydroxy-6-metoxy-1,4-benzoquinol methylase
VRKLLNNRPKDNIEDTAERRLQSEKQRFLARVILKQNIYDNPGFFKGYRRMREKGDSLNEMVEQLAMLSLLPEVKGMAVLDLGCGTGELSRRIKALGAHQVTATDISANMLEIARQDNPQGITFEQRAMEDLKFKPQTFDLVVSSLALHYVADLAEISWKIYDWLKPSGTFLFSVEHPVLTSSQGIHRGWVKDQSGNKLCWPVDNYSEEGMRESHWFVEGVIKYHRTLSAILNSLIDAGFVIKKILEPKATAADEANWPELKEAGRRPPFLIVKAVK